MPRGHTPASPPPRSPPPGSSPLWLPALPAGFPTGDASKRPGGRSRGQTEVILRLSVPLPSVRLCQQLPLPSEPRGGLGGVCVQRLCSLPHVVFSPKTCDLRRSPWPPLGDPSQVGRAETSVTLPWSEETAPGRLGQEGDQGTQEKLLEQNWMITLAQT